MRSDLPQANRSTFGWTQLPAVRDLQPDEPVGGNLVFPGTTGSIRPRGSLPDRTGPARQTCSRSALKTSPVHGENPPNETVTHAALAAVLIMLAAALTYATELPQGVMQVAGKPGAATAAGQPRRRGL